MGGRCRPCPNSVEQGEFPKALSTPHACLCWDKAPEDEWNKKNTDPDRDEDIMTSSMIETVLRDGRKVVVRQIREDDYQRVLRYFDGLSERSRGWFHPHPFDEPHARMIVQTHDGRGAVRLAATADGPDGPMVGYVYYDHPERRHPHVGIGVIDPYQDQGLGRILMDAIIDDARRNRKPGLSLVVDKPNHRALRLYSQVGFRISGQNPPGTHHQMTLEFAAQESPFEHRCLYLHPIDWKLTHLTADTWTLHEWKLYLDLIQGAGANTLKIFIWPTQYFHKSFPQTSRNQWLWQVLREALLYARVLGLKTSVGFAGACVPPFVWQAHPEKRAEEVNYRGIHLCWQRGKEEILQFSAHLIDTFAEVADGFVVWHADPGVCICPRCCNYTPVVQDMMRTYEGLIGERAAVHHCPWWIWHMEAGTGGLPKTPNIRADVFGSMKRGEWTLVYDQDEASIRVAQQAGLKVLSFAFFMDPEGGHEARNILPRTYFQRIEKAVDRAQKLGIGLLGYRLTPFTQFHSDWLFFQRQLYPDVSRQRALERLAEFLGVGADYVEALLLLDDWWAGQEDGYDLAKLRGAADILRGLKGRRPEYLSHVCEAVDMLLLLGERGLASGWQVTDELVGEMQQRMEQGVTFTSFTHEQLWAAARARPFIKRRARLWMEAIAPPIS